jgi:hypothetical protein
MSTSRPMHNFLRTSHFKAWRKTGTRESERFSRLASTRIGERYAQFSWNGRPFRPTHTILIDHSKATTSTFEKRQQICNQKEEHLKAFIQLKEAIILTCMSHFRNNWETYIFSDAGPAGCAGMLTQENPKEERDVRLVGCGSHCFTPSECNYSHLEKEAYSCVWCTEFFHAYVYGAHFIILTDSLAAKKIFSEDKPRKKVPLRLQRLKSRLQLYGNATIIHIEGKKNIADFLSRHMPLRPDSLNNNIENEYHINRVIDDDQMRNDIRALIEKQIPDFISIDEVSKATADDQELQSLKSCITGSAQPKGTTAKYKSIMDELWIAQDGIIMRGEAIVLPASLHQRAVAHVHEGHLGIVLSKRLLKSRTWFSGADAAVEQEIRDCLPCQANSDNTEHAPMVLQEIPKHNLSLVSLDFSSRTPSNDYLLVAIYEKARYPAYSISRHITSEQAVIHTKKIFEKHGTPEEVKTDNGPAFRGATFTDFLKKLGIKHTRITPLNPEANGGCERLMRLINKCIRCANVEGKSWKPIVEKWLNTYRATPHSTTVIAPEQAMDLPSNFTKLPSKATTATQSVIQRKVEENSRASRNKQKKYADNTHKSKQVSFKEGDKVLYKWPRSNKHQSIFDPDAYVITKVKNNTIEATRDDMTPSYICRNCRFFKQISDKCFEASIKRRSKSLPPREIEYAPTSSIITATVVDQQSTDVNGHLSRGLIRVDTREPEDIAPTSAHPGPDVSGLTQRYPHRDTKQPNWYDNNKSSRQSSQH